MRIRNDFKTMSQRSPLISGRIRNDFGARVGDFRTMSRRLQGEVGRSHVQFIRLQGDIRNYFGTISLRRRFRGGFGTISGLFRGECRTI